MMINFSFICVAVCAWNNNQEFRAEIEILCNVHHPHINRLLAVSTNGPNSCLILEYMDEGSLDARLLDKELPVLQWRQRARVLLHVARGLACMHALDPPVVHRDVKCGNILLAIDSGEEGGGGTGDGGERRGDEDDGEGEGPRLVAKICDFGWVKLMQSILCLFVCR